MDEVLCDIPPSYGPIQHYSAQQLHQLPPTQIHPHQVMSHNQPTQPVKSSKREKIVNLKPSTSAHLMQQFHANATQGISVQQQAVQQSAAPLDPVLQQKELHLDLKDTKKGFEKLTNRIT